MTEESKIKALMSRVAEIGFNASYFVGSIDATQMRRFLNGETVLLIERFSDRYQLGFIPPQEKRSDSTTNE